MKGEDIFPSKYLKAADLKGRPHMVTISHCGLEQLGNDQKLITYFQGKEKGLVTNKTNFGRIAYMHGDETDDWPGCKIVLAPELVDFQGKSTMAIRVRSPNGVGPKKPPLQETENPAEELKPAPRQPAATHRQPATVAPPENNYAVDGDADGFSDEIPF